MARDDFDAEAFSDGTAVNARTADWKSCRERAEHYGADALYYMVECHPPDGWLDYVAGMAARTAREAFSNAQIVLDREAGLDPYRLRLPSDVSS